MEQANTDTAYSANGGYYQSCGSSVGGNCDLNYANLECDCKGPQGNIRSSIGLGKHQQIYRKSLEGF